MQNETAFIVGCARTGSTLLRQILNKSEQICLASETHFLRRISAVGRDRRILKFGDMARDENVAWLVDYLYSDTATPATGYWGWLKSNVDRAVFARRILASDRSDRAIFTIMIELFVERKKGSLGGDLVVGEKTPSHLYYVPALFEWFPRTKIIHTFRDPRGIFVSTLRRMQTDRWGLKARYPSLPARLVDPLITPITTLFTTKTWFDAVRLHTRYQQLYPGRYHLVRFEDLVGEPERTVRGLCDFLGVPFDRQMIDEVVVVSSSYRAQRRGPGGFDTQSINRWQAHIDPFTKAWFSILGRRYLRSFGYLP